MQDYPQILNDITKGKRDITPGLSLKIDKPLMLEEGTMLILQAHYEIKKEKHKHASEDRPDLTIIRKAVFWDTDMNSIDWRRQYRAVIRRVFERGNAEEKAETLRFYGEDKILTVIGRADLADNRIPVMSHQQKNNASPGR